MNIKTERIAQLIKKEISDIIQFSMKERRIGLVTITDVEVTNDLSIAKVYFTIMDRKDRIEEDIMNLKRAKGFIRTTLSKRLKTYKVPDLIFIQDDSLEIGNRIDNIIKDITYQTEE